MDPILEAPRPLATAYGASALCDLRQGEVMLRKCVSRFWRIADTFESVLARPVPVHTIDCLRLHVQNDDMQDAVKSAMNLPVHHVSVRRCLRLTSIRSI